MLRLGNCQDESAFPTLRFLPGDPPADLHRGRSAGKGCPACVVRGRSPSAALGWRSAGKWPRTARLHSNGKLAHVPEETIKPLTSHLHLTPRPLSSVSSWPQAGDHWTSLLVEVRGRWRAISLPRLS